MSVSARLRYEFPLMLFQKKIPVGPILVVMVVSVRKSVEASPATALWDSKDLLARVRHLIYADLLLLAMSRSNQV